MKTISSLLPYLTLVSLAACSATTDMSELTGGESGDPSADSCDPGVESDCTQDARGRWRRRQDAGVTTTADSGVSAPPPVVVADSGAAPPPAVADSGTTTTTTPPSSTEFPTPDTTGYKHTGVTLTTYTGPSNITVAGTVIDSKQINTCLTISAPNVTIKRSKIACSGSYGLQQTDYNGANSGLLVEDTEITSTSNTALVDRAVALTNGATLRRAYIHGTQRGIALGDNTTIVDSYAGDNFNLTDAHCTAIATWGGTKHVIVRNNTLKAKYNASSAMSFYPENPWGGNEDFVIDHNLLATDGGYTVYLGNGSGEQPNTNFTFTNNHFSTEYEAKGGLYGPVASWSAGATGNVWSGNVWHDGAMKGLPVNP